jgi:hypothetical protein
MQESMIRLNLDLPNKKFRFDLDAIMKQYTKVAQYNCKHIQWESDVYVLKEIKSNYIDDRSKAEFHRLYKALRQIKDVDSYHNIHLEKPYEIIKLLHL